MAAVFGVRAASRYFIELPLIDWVQLLALGLWGVLFVLVPYLLPGDVVAWPLEGRLYVTSGSYLASSTGIEVR